jgi:hypothetical protein
VEVHVAAWASEPPRRRVVGVRDLLHRGKCPNDDAAFGGVDLRIERPRWPGVGGRYQDWLRRRGGMTKRQARELSGSSANFYSAS